LGGCRHLFQRASPKCHHGSPTQRLESLGGKTTLQKSMSRLYRVHLQALLLLCYHVGGLLSMYEDSGRMEEVRGIAVQFALILGRNKKDRAAAAHPAGLAELVTMSKFSHGSPAQRVRRDSCLGSKDQNFSSTKGGPLRFFILPIPRLCFFPFRLARFGFAKGTNLVPTISKGFRILHGA
jgi:hypothetical protein